MSKAGAYFGTVLLPGIVALCATLAVLAWIAPWPARWGASRAAVVAAGALVVLGGWAALSAVWSPAPDLATTDGQRILAYAIAFGLGIWLCLLLGPRVHLVRQSRRGKPERPGTPLEQAT